MTGFVRPGYIFCMYAYIILYMFTILYQNTQAVIKSVAIQKGQDEKGFEIKGGDQEMAIMMLMLIIFNDHPSLFILLKNDWH